MIVIDEARYGRQRLGRCVTHDYGHLGCSADVADLLDQACSGLRLCQFSVSSIRDIVHPCPKDLTAYLEATYRCITRKIAKASIVTAIVEFFVMLYVILSAMLYCTISYALLTFDE